MGENVPALSSDASQALQRLSDVESNFVWAYLSDPGPTGALRAARESCGASTDIEAKKAAAEILSREHVSRAIKLYTECFALSAETILAEVSDLAMPDTSRLDECFTDTASGYRYFDWGKAHRLGLAKYVQKVSPGRGQDLVTLHDRSRSLEMLGRHRALWNETPQISVNLDLRNLSNEELQALAAGRKLDDAKPDAGPVIDLSYRTPREPE